MLNIGFFELLLISVVALLVLGPEKLPGAIRTTALWVGRARRSFNKVKTEIEQQINADDIRRQLHNESILADLKETRDKTRSLIDESGKDARKISDDLSNSMKELASRKDFSLLDEKQDEAAPKDVDPVNAGEAPEAEIPCIAPQELPEKAAAPEENEEQVSPEENPASKAPPEDFYNNPGTGVVELQGGRPRSRETGDDEAREEKPETTQPDQGGKNQKRQ